MLRSRFEISRNWTTLLCSSVTKRKRKSIFMPRTYDASRSRRNSYQRMDPKQCPIWPNLGQKSLHQIQKIQYWSSGSVFAQRSNRILDENCERYWQICQISFPIQEEEKASGKPAAKARPILKPSSTSGWDFTLIEQRQWIDIEIQEFRNPKILIVFQLSKFITRLLRHGQQVNREEDAGVHNDQVIDECKQKLSDDSGYWSDEMEKQFANAPYWSREKWESVLAKRWRTKEKVSILLESELSSSILVFSSNSRTFRKNNHFLSRRVIHGLVPGGVSLRTGRQAVFFTVVEPMDNQDGLGENLCDLSQARIAPYLLTFSKYCILVQFEARSTKRTANLSNKIKRSYSPRHTACRVYWESDMHEDQGLALSKGKRDSKTACYS